MGCSALNLHAWALRILALTFLGLAAGYANAQDVRDASQLGDVIRQLADPELIKYLKETGIRSVPDSDLPGAGEVQRKITALVKKLWLSKDGTEPIYVLVADDTRVNARFVRDKDGAKMVIVNTGLLNFAENDDQLAHVLGHELEHGTSEIGEHVRSLASGVNTSLRQELQIAGLNRSEEVEVDIKSVVNRVHKQGCNLYESIRLLDRMYLTDDRPSYTHAKDETRRNLLETAVTALTRGGGEKIDALLAKPMEGLDGAYAAIKNANLPDREKSTLSLRHYSETNELWQQLQRTAFGVLTPAENVDERRKLREEKSGLPRSSSNGADRDPVIRGTGSLTSKASASSGLTMPNCETRNRAPWTRSGASGQTRTAHEKSVTGPPAQVGRADGENVLPSRVSWVRKSCNGSSAPGSLVLVKCAWPLRSPGFPTCGGSSPTLAASSGWLARKNSDGYSPASATVQRGFIARGNSSSTTECFRHIGA